MVTEYRFDEQISDVAWLCHLESSELQHVMFTSKQTQSREDEKSDDARN
jgi:hypothetical protein